MKKDLSNLKYVILPGKFPSDPYAQKLHNQAFLFWKDFWNKTFKENESDHLVNPDNFWRQDRITLLMYGEEIIGQHLYSVFNLDSLAAQSHSYLNNSYNEDFFKKLKMRNVLSVMSLEYLAITPQWRSKHCDVSLASVLIGLACKHQKMYTIDALIAPSRTDLKVTEMATDRGAEVLTKGLKMYNTPIDLIAIFANKNKLHPDFNVNVMVERLWSQRLVYTESVQNTDQRIAS